MINIALCDDEQEFLDRMQNELHQLADKLDFTIETYLYTDGNKVVDLIDRDQENFHILFLDIDMQGISGLEVARKIREKGSDIILIFVSAHEQYVFDSIEYNPFRYIRKSRIEKELPLALRAACARIEELKDDQIVVKTENSEVKIKHSEIMYFETSARKLAIHLSNGKILEIRKTIKELCEALNDDHFIRLHSGCVANVKYINKFSNYDITLDNGEQLIISRGRVKDVKRKLMDYWGG